MAGEKDVLTAEQKRLVERNVGLAQKISHDYVRNSSTYDLEDIVSAAYQGLIRAAQTFDPVAAGMSEETIANGKAFGGYARLKINGAILDWQKSNDYVQRSHRQIYKKLQGLGFGRDRGRKDLLFFSHELGLSEDKIREAIHSVENPAVSIHSEYDFSDDDADLTYTNTIPAHDDVESSAFATGVQDSVARAVDDMPDIYQVVIAMKYYGHFELQQIAQELAMSMSAVREIHSEAILQIYQAMHSHIA